MEFSNSSLKHMIAAAFEKIKDEPGDVLKKSEIRVMKDVSVRKLEFPEHSIRQMCLNHNLSQENETNQEPLMWTRENEQRKEKLMVTAAFEKIKDVVNDDVFIKPGRQRLRVMKSVSVLKLELPEQSGTHLCPTYKLMPEIQCKSSTIRSNLESTDCNNNNHPESCSLPVDVKSEPKDHEPTTDEDEFIPNFVLDNIVLPDVKPEFDEATDTLVTSSQVAHDVVPDSTRDGSDVKVEERLTYFCGSCGLALQSYDELCEHAKSHFPELPKPKPKRTIPSISKRLPKRRLITLKKASLSKSPRTSNETCVRCHKTFPTPNSLEYHKVHVHLIGYRVKCTICNLGYQNQNQLDDHMLKHSDNRKFKCKFCSNTAFKSKGNLSKHIKLVHSDVRNFPCGRCSQSFKSNEHLKQHNRKVHSKPTDKTNELFKCELCWRDFKSILSRDYHAATFDHSEERKYKCKLCPKDFNTSQNLRKHLMTHSDERNFKCESCLKVFKFSYDLKKHEKTHSGSGKAQVSRPCFMCKKTFATSSNLSRHYKEVHKVSVFDFLSKPVKNHCEVNRTLTVNDVDPIS